MVCGAAVYWLVLWCVGLFQWGGGGCGGALWHCDGLWCIMGANNQCKRELRP